MYRKFDVKFCCPTGNAVQTVKSLDKVKVISVRGTSFEPAASGGSAATGKNFKITKNM